jgi:hypothetical protein
MTTKLLVLLAFALVALLVACDNGDNGDNGDATPSPGLTPGATVSAQNGETPTPVATLAETPTAVLEICQPNPDPATPEFQVIDQPSAGDTLASPVTISGQVLANEATFQVGIFDIVGNPIVETFDTAEAAEIGVLAPFSIDVEFEVDLPTPACIWVYEASARDGSPVHVGQIPVTLAP